MSGLTHGHGRETRLKYAEECIGGDKIEVRSENISRSFVMGSARGVRTIERANWKMWQKEHLKKVTSHFLVTIQSGRFD